MYIYILCFEHFYGFFEPTIYIYIYMTLFRRN